MMISRRRFGGLAALAASSGVLSACGSSGSGESSDGTVTLQMVESITSPDRTQLLKSMLADFEKANPKIKVNLISPPTDQADQKIQQMLQAGSGVDVLEVRDLTVGPFSNNGWLYNMAPDIKKWSGFSKLTDQAKKFAVDTDGKSYYIPYGFYGLSLFYRTDLVKDAGFSGAPGSWADLITQAEKIQDPSKNRYGYAFRGGSNSIGQVMSILQAYNADNINIANAYKVKSGSTIFSTAESQTAIDKYIELYRNGSPKSSVAWGYAEMVQGFTNGSTAFLLQDPEVINTVQKSSLKSDQWAVATNPVGPTGKAAWPKATAGWGVAKSSKHTADAVKLVLWLSGDPSTEFAKKNSLVPIQKNAADDPFFKTGPWAAYVTMTQHPETWISVEEPRSVAWWTEWGQKSEADLQKVLTNSMSTKDLLAGWNQFWTSKWKG
jgi:multiple sugar transport system substrate-binding protein